MNMTIALALAAGLQGASATRPLNTGDWITINDYPAEALTQRQQGVVRVRLDIDAAGRVAGCTIVTGSGAPSLDAATCALLFVRARFAAATDATGQGVPGVFTTRITWRYPDSIATPPTPAPINLGSDLIQESIGGSELRVDQQGMITACEPAESTYVNTLAPPNICGFFPVGTRFSPPTLRNGKPVRRKVTARLSIRSETVR